MSPFIQEIIGKNDPNVLGAAFFFALLGHILILLGGTLLREPKSPNSPEKLSFTYLLWDNTKRILYVLLLIIISLRFAPDLLGIQVTSWGGFLIGIGLDSIALAIKQKTKFFDHK
jgi:hypothetical protein